MGHETDVTIADFVADLRAPTPSAAAELIVCHSPGIARPHRRPRTEAGPCHALSAWPCSRAAGSSSGIERPLGLLHRTIGRQAQRIDELEFRLRDIVRTRLERYARAQRSLVNRLRYFDLRPRFAADRRRLDQAHAAAEQSLRWQLARRRAAVEQLSAKLSQLSPLQILDRGYAIVTNQTGAIVKDSAAAPPDSAIQVRLASGGLHATVTSRS